MASRYHGVAPGTYERMILDAGEVRMNFTDLDNPGTRLGATRGGSTFLIEPEYKEMEVDGAPGPVMGGHRIVRVECKLTCNFVEFNEDILKLALPGGTVADASETYGENLKQITRAMKLYASSYTEPYKDNIVLFAEVAGTSTPVIVGVKNALQTGSFELSLEDKDEAVVSIEFSAHFDPEDLEGDDSTEPFILLYPDTFERETTTTAEPTTTTSIE